MCSVPAATHRACTVIVSVGEVGAARCANTPRASKNARNRCGAQPPMIVATSAASAGCCSFEYASTRDSRSSITAAPPAASVRLSGQGEQIRWATAGFGFAAN